MSSPRVDFISGLAQQSGDKSEQDLSLCYAYPVIDNYRKTNSMLINDKKVPRIKDNGASLAADGLYVSANPFTNKIVKPYRLDSYIKPDRESRSRFHGKFVEIAIRDVRIHDAPQSDRAGTTIEIVLVSILYKGKPICKTNSPYNRKLYKLLIKNLERHDLSIQIHARHGKCSVVPLPLPVRRYVKDSKVEIDFAISDDSERIHSGTITCTISLSTPDDTDEECNVLCRPSNDPNDPQNALALSKPQVIVGRKDIKYFLLEDPALIFDTNIDTIHSKTQTRESKSPDIVVTEPPAFTLLNVSLKSLFRVSRPLRPSPNAAASRRHRVLGKTVLTVTILRGVEVPVREESASVSPFLEVQWGNVVRATSIADGPAPIWQQTVHFEPPKQNGEHCVKFRLYDQHPVWGQQWLGEARIPIERHRHYRELERWIALSPLFSPVLLFGYVQASPGQSHTRIYVLIKMEQPGDTKSVETKAIDALSKSIQRCLANPCKLAGVETIDDALRFTMLLPSLPLHYGPITPRQALNVNKVDHYGRAALLTTLLQSFGLQSYVLLGSSQISRWTAFVLSMQQDDFVLWDPEIGERFKLNDSRCSLMKVSRLINYSGVWENLQQSVLPYSLKYNVTISKDWRPLTVVTSVSNRPDQTLELVVKSEEDAREKETAAQMEQYLRDKLSASRSALGLTTIFNRHAVTVLRAFISDIPNDVKHQLDRRDLKQLYRAYHTHGFILNLRRTTLNELAEQIVSTKVHNITGPIEFALVCHIQRYIGKICSIWLALAILRSR